MRCELTLKRVWVRIFSTKSKEGMRSLSPPNGAFSRFTNPLRRRVLRLRFESDTENEWRKGKTSGKRAYQTAFIMRRLIVKYLSPIRMTGN